MLDAINGTIIIFFMLSAHIKPADRYTQTQIAGTTMPFSLSQHSTINYGGYVANYPRVIVTTIYVNGSLAARTRERTKEAPRSERTERPNREHTHAPTGGRER